MSIKLFSNITDLLLLTTSATYLIILIVPQQFEQSLGSHRAMDPLDVRTILGTIGSLALQVNTLQDRNPSPNSLPNLYPRLVRLQLELPNCLTVQDRYDFFIVTYLHSNIYP